VSTARCSKALRRIAKRQRESTLDPARFTLSDLEIRARSEVRLAQEAVRLLERALESARRAAQQAAEVVTITTTAFELGATTNLEVIDAQRIARDADTAAAIAEDAVRRARLELLVALGRFRNRKRRESFPRRFPPDICNRSCKTVTGRPDLMLLGIFARHAWSTGAMEVESVRRGRGHGVLGHLFVPD
jgi:hypothetical protein